MTPPTDMTPPKEALPDDMKWASCDDGLPPHSGYEKLILWIAIPKETANG